MSDDSPRGADATLVVGADEVAHERACRHLVGEETGDCLRVTTDESDAHVCTETISAFEDGVVFGDMELPEVGVAFSEAVGNYDSAGEETLQVCLDGLPHVEDDPAREALFRFLHAAIARVRTVGGECHAHLDASASTELVHVVEPLFDTVLEVENEAEGGEDVVGAARAWSELDAEPTRI